MSDGPIGGFFTMVISYVVLATAYYAWKEYKKPGSVVPVNSSGGIDHGRAGRECMVCGYKGRMATWIGNHGAPQFIILVGLLFMVIPGLIFMGLYWGKYKCPSCGSIGRNKPLGETPAVDPDPVYNIQGTKSCPFCAETIKQAAVVCRFCNRDLTPVAQAAEE